MQFRALGPDGVQRRIGEIERRIGEALGETANPDASTDFGTQLRGQIGQGSVAPVNPMGPGFRLDRTEAAAQFGPLIEKAALDAGIDPQLFDALVASESAYNPAARSRAGALGLSQLMPGTASELGVQNPFDPAQNLGGGAQYLAKMLQRFGGDPRKALAAYNAGPGAVEKFGGVPPYAETQRYVEKVLGLYEARRPK